VRSAVGLLSKGLQHRVHLLDLGRLRRVDLPGDRGELGRGACLQGDVAHLDGWFVVRLHAGEELDVGGVVLR
jgi:hypothetical protein